MIMEKNNFKMVDKHCEDFDTDLTFILETDCPKEELEEIEKNAEWIWYDYPKEDLDEEYRKFVPNLYGWSKYEIMQEIVEQKGYSWNRLIFDEIEW